MEAKEKIGLIKEVLEKDDWLSNEELLDDIKDIVNYH